MTTPEFIKRFGIAIIIEKRVMKNKVLKRNSLIGIFDIIAKEKMKNKKSNKGRREFDIIEANIRIIKEINFALGSIF